MARILVTGANGFIGSHLVRELLKRGHAVRGLVRHTADLSSLVGVPLELYIGDVRDPATLAAPMQGVDYIYHLAAELMVTSEAAFKDTNTRGTLHMLEAAEKFTKGTLKRFLYVSSEAAAGPSADTTPLVETDARKPVSWYGESKMQAEDIAHSFAGRVPVTIVRPSSVYGEREKDISQVFPAVQQRLQPKVGVLPKFTVMVYVQDLVQGFIAAAESDKTIDQVYFLNHPQLLDAGQLTKTIAAACNKSAGLRFPVPIFLFRLAAPFAEALHQFNRQRPPITRDKAREVAQRFWVADPSKAKRDFGWAAQHDLLHGMQNTTQYYFDVQRRNLQMPLESGLSRWLKYLAVAVLLGGFIEISSATGGFYKFDPAWFVFVIVFGAFGLSLGTLAMLLRMHSALVQFLAGSLLAGAVELANVFHLLPNVRWDFAFGWPFGITSPIWRSVVLGMAGGAFVLIVNAILLALYKRRLRLG
jgi:nucleoside-diphosphate-sugar epimerase